MRVTRILALALAAITMAAADKPPAEQALIDVVKEYAAKFGDAGNDMVKGGIRAARAKAICNIVGDGQVQDWVATVKTLDSSSDGKGVLILHLTDDITLGTFNNGLSDSLSEPHTLIAAGSDLFNAASGLKEDQTVIFSGILARGPNDCIEETSMGIDGAMTEPDFIMKFTAVKPAGD